MILQPLLDLLLGLAQVLLPDFYSISVFAVDLLLFLLCLDHLILYSLLSNLDCAGGN